MLKNCVYSQVAVTTRVYYHNRRLLLV